MWPLRPLVPPPDPRRTAPLARRPHRRQGRGPRALAPDPGQSSGVNVGRWLPRPPRRPGFPRPPFSRRVRPWRRLQGVTDTAQKVWECLAPWTDPPARGFPGNHRGEVPCFIEPPSTPSGLPHPLFPICKVKPRGERFTPHPRAPQGPTNPPRSYFSRSLRLIQQSSRPIVPSPAPRFLEALGPEPQRKERRPGASITERTGW